MPRSVSGSRVVFPRPEKIPEFTEDLGRRLERSSGWQGAFEAHFDLVSIHPLADGNGRTARLLMNLLLRKATLRCRSAPSGGRSTSGRSRRSRSRNRSATDW